MPLIRFDIRDCALAEQVFSGIRPHIPGSEIAWQPDDHEHVTLTVYGISPLKPEGWQADLDRMQHTGRAVALIVSDQEDDTLARLREFHEKCRFKAVGTCGRWTLEHIGKTFLGTRVVCAPENFGTDDQRFGMLMAKALRYAAGTLRSRA